MGPSRSALLCAWTSKAAIRWRLLLTRLLRLLRWVVWCGWISKGLTRLRLDRSRRPDPRAGDRRGARLREDRRVEPQDRHKGMRPREGRSRADRPASALQGRVARKSPDPRGSDSKPQSGKTPSQQGSPGRFTPKSRPPSSVGRPPKSARPPRPGTASRPKTRRAGPFGPKSPPQSKHAPKPGPSSGIGRRPPTSGPSARQPRAGLQQPGRPGSPVQPGKAGIQGKVVVKSYKHDGPCPKKNGSLVITGRGFGRGPGANRLMLVLDGTRNRFPLPVKGWSDTQIQTSIPNSPRIQTGDRFVYFVGLQDRRGNWVSNTDKKFTICQ